jgi:hypothetical protein
MVPHLDLNLAVQNGSVFILAFFGLFIPKYVGEIITKQRSPVAFPIQKQLENGSELQLVKPLGDKVT